MIAHSGMIAAAALLLAICAAPVRAEPPGGPYGPLPGIAEEPDPAVHAANVCALIEGAADGNSAGVLSLAGGCLCCSFGDDLVGTLNGLAQRSPPPDVCLVELSGVALPAAVVGLIFSDIADRIM